MSPVLLLQARQLFNYHTRIIPKILYNIPICSKVFPNHLRTCSFIPRTCTLYDRLCLSASMCHLVLLLQPRQLLNDHTRLNTQSCTTFPIVRKCSLTISGHVVLFPGHANFLTVYVSLPQMCHVMVLVQPRQLWSNLPRFIPQSGTTFPSVLKCSQTILGHVALFPGHAHFLTVFVCLPQCVTCAIAPAETTFQLSYQNNSQILYNIPICSKVFPNHLRAMYFYFQDMQIV